MAVKNKLYEAMFLVDAADSQADWDGVESNIRNILARVDAEIISLEKWDTRRLVYAIDKKSMGTYILCYFRADGKRMAEIERTVQLSERIMRVLILSADHVTQSDIEKDTPTIVAEKPEQPTGAGPGETAGVETVSAKESSEAEAAPAEVSREAAGPVSVEEDSKSEPEAAAVAEETPEESKELEEQAEPRRGRKMRSEKAEAVAEVSEREQQVEDQAKDGSESTDEQDTEKSKEKEE